VAQQDERCVKRALRLASLLVVLAVVGLAYWGMFLAGSPSTMAQSSSQVIANAFCGLGLGSLISLLAFVFLGAVYRNRTGQRREEVRQFAEKLLEKRLGNPAIPPLPGAVMGQQIFSDRNAAIVPASTSVNPREPFLKASVSPDSAAPA
jgi:hypothetical protein